jgi:hypothetical protein
MAWEKGCDDDVVVAFSLPYMKQSWYIVSALK